MDDWHHWLIILACLAFSAFFSGMEIAFISANRLKIEVDRRRGGVNSRIIARFVKNPSQLISAMLLGNNIALVVYGLYMGEILTKWLSSYTSSNALILVIQTAVSTLIILLTAEFLPKAILGIQPNRAIKAGAIPLALANIILMPMNRLVMWISQGVLKLAGLKETSEDQAFTTVDLDHYVTDMTERMGAEHEMENEVTYLKNALEFSNVRARDCMVPRTELEALDIHSDIDELKQKFIDTGLSKILIYREDIDNVIGFAHINEMFKKPESIKQIILPISIVPEAMLANELLETLTKQRRSLAIVVDEYGGTSGLVTFEDIIEELVGDIVDEFDQDELVEEQVNDREFLFSARLEIDDLNEKYDLNLPESEEYETLAGLILHELERIPEKGSIVQHPHFKIQVIESTETRVDVVRLTLL